MLPIILAIKIAILTAAPAKDITIHEGRIPLVVFHAMRADHVVPAANRPRVTPGNVHGNRPVVPPGLRHNYGTP